nr:hypothetical protein GCM10020092_077470 [Actinoplanes digitatis]
MPGRDIASVAADAATVADALGVAEFAVLGHSGGGPCALACAALLPGRVTAAVAISCLAPYESGGLDWYAGMGPSGEATLRAAAAGRAAKEAHEAAGASDVDFIPADWAALEGEWGWFGSVVEPAMACGPAPLIDDDLSYVNPWGFDPAAVAVPVLLVHGTGDRVVPSAHSTWLADHISGSTLRLVEGEGHVSVLPPAAVPGPGVAAPSLNGTHVRIQRW